ncbi:MAG: type II toxin-antitoxin system RelE/ParE family toxin [Fibromonadaceae bacterium]|jgi:phage-related protein|nr:type II toxin-antitoxin system RelE/ParE family toxin [Fibromonadaceae bacterium]
MKEYIAYLGEAFTIEWYFDSVGNSDALNYFNEQSDIQKRKLLMLFKRMGDFGKISDIAKFRNEGEQIFAFKPQPDRYLSFFHSGKKIIVTNAFAKKSDKLPKSEKDKSLARKLDYEQRTKGGSYYEK